MSLLQEARERIRIQKDTKPATEGIFKERHDRRLKDLRTLIGNGSEQAGQAWRVEERKKRELQSEIRSMCAELLIRHGDLLNSDERYLSTIIGEGEVSVSILSKSLQPEEGNIIVQVQGLSTFLELSTTRTGVLWKNDGMFSWESATSMTLGEYKDVVGSVKEKFQPAAPVQSPR